MSTICKKLVNATDRCVDECLEGLVAINPGLRLLEGHRVVVRSDIEEYLSRGNVSVVCGGGSGHEPAHAGFVGEGMLSGAVAGAVFTSPPPESILACLRAVAKKSSGGTVVIIKNYTGDRINFGLALERAKSEGYIVDMVVVAEDCALQSSDKTAGRRGLSGTILIEKICGALAEEGKSLEEIVYTATNAIKKMGTIGLSLSPCTIPGAGATFTLGHDEMELGLGIHGEAGVKRTKLVSAKEAVQMMIDHMTDPSNNSRLDVKKGDRVACMINNLGGTSVLELNIVAKEAVSLLESRGVTVERVYCGPFTTSLEMAGISITLLHLDDTLRRCLDAVTSAPGWIRPYLPPGEKTRKTPLKIKINNSHSNTSNQSYPDTVTPDVKQKIHNCIKTAANSLIASEEKLNNLDKECGDGDCGSTMARGAQAILTSLDSNENSLPVGNPAELARRLGYIAEGSMGGSSGGVYSLFFTAVAGELEKGLTLLNISSALSAGVATIRKYGGADPGDRTMLDALYPACKEMEASVANNKTFLEALAAAVTVCKDGALSTAAMKARAGRASYVSQDRLTNPDPGAMAVHIWLSAVLEVLKQ